MRTNPQQTAFRKSSPCSREVQGWYREWLGDRLLLNDRLSLDGRDPSTYGNLARAWGDAAPGYRDNPVYGLVQTRTDRAIRKRPGGAEWIAHAAKREGPRLDVPAAPPADPYLSEKLPI